MPSIVDMLKKKYGSGVKGDTIAEAISSLSTTPSDNIAEALAGFTGEAVDPTGDVAYVGTAKVGFAKVSV